MHFIDKEIVNQIFYPIICNSNSKHSIWYPKNKPNWCSKLWYQTDLAPNQHHQTKFTCRRKYHKQNMLLTSANLVLSINLCSIKHDLAWKMMFLSSKHSTVGKLNLESLITWRNAQFGTFPQAHLINIIDLLMHRGGNSI